MKSRTTAAVAVFATILIAAVPALAARKPVPQLSPSTPVPVLKIGAKEGVVPTCTAGHNLPGTVEITPWLQPPNDAYYTLLDPSTCATCPEGILVTKAHIVLNFPVACQQPIVVSVVGNSGTDQCPYPNPAEVVCPAENHVLNGATPGRLDFTIDLNTSCPVTQKAFLCFRFDAFGAACNSPDANRPQLVIAGDGPCNMCTSYNFYPPGFEDDECGGDVGFPGPPAHYVEADCVQTPTLPTHWGRVKVLYR